MNRQDKINFPISYKSIAVCDIIALILMFLLSGVLILDELEHLHAAYFISDGFMPFRDFFEHHHPLFLFFLAPLVKIIPQNAISVLFVSRFIMTLFSLGTFYYIYKISERFLGGKFCALLSVLIFLSFYPTLYMFSIVKPDTVMNFFFVCGLYYFFEYNQTLKTKPLVICTTTLILSFLFLQTAVFLIAPLLIIFLYIIYKNPQQIKNMLYAGIFPLILLIAFAVYLYATDSLEIYFQSCWIFNAKFFSLLNFKLPSVLPDFIIYIIFGYIAYGFLLFKKQANFYIHAIAFLLSFSLIKNLIYPTYYPRYLLSCFFYTSLLAAAALKDAKSLIHTYLKFTLLALLSINIYITFAIYNNRTTLKVLNMIKPNDSCLSYYANEQNIYQPLYSYYWYAPSISSVDNYLFNRYPDYNINEIIKSNKFKYILYNRQSCLIKCPIPNENTDENFKSTYRQHTIDDKVLESYDYINDYTTGIYKLKAK